MEEERFYSGYCKALDQSRMVAVLFENEALTETDCAYPNCPHAPSCPIAKKIQEQDMRYSVSSSHI